MAGYREHEGDDVIMGKQATGKRTPEGHRRDLYELYLRRTDRINDWVVEQVAADHLMGADKDRLTPDGWPGQPPQEESSPVTPGT